MVFPSQNPSCAIVASILPHLLLPLYVNINVVSSDAQTVDRFVFSTHLDHLCLTSDAPNNGKTLSGCMFECFFWFPVFFVWISCSTLFLYQLHLYCIVWIAWLDFCISRLDFLFNSCSTLCWYKLICIVDRRHQFSLEAALAASAQNWSLYICTFSAQHWSHQTCTSSKPIAQMWSQCDGTILCKILQNSIVPQKWTENWSAYMCG